MKIEPQTLGRLASIGFQNMAAFRKNRLAALNRYVGRWYGKVGEADDRAKAAPINLIYQGATTLVPNLVFNNPKVSVSSRFLAYREYANLLAMAVNHLVEEIDLRFTLRCAVTDAIFMAAFVKTGLGVSGQTLDIDGTTHDIGQPYADRVDPDDMTLDPIARTWEEQRLVGNRFRIDKQTLQESGLVDPDKVERLSSRYQEAWSQQGAAGIGAKRGEDAEADQLEGMLDLVELFIPEAGLIVTMPWTPGHLVAEDFLHTVDYEGPEQGPYKMLGFAFVPDRILPVAPAMVWTDLHDMANKIARKVARQAERGKKVLAYEATAWQDAQDIVDADDGESVRVDNIDGIKEVAFGGASEDAYRYVDWAKAQFAEMAMNLDILSGAGARQPTATQSEMIQSNTSIRLSDMQILVYQFVQGIARDLAFFLHTDPLIDLPMVRRVAGRDTQVRYTPEMREGDWLDYTTKVQPYSMARVDPNLKVRRLLEFSGSVIPALASAFQMLGPAFNLQAAIRIIGQEMGVEELDEIINDEVLARMSARLQQLIEQGVGVPAGVAKVLGQTAGAGPLPGGVRPQQPNPAGAVPQGITPAAERNAGFQQPADELQQTYPSAWAQAQAKGAGL